MTSKNKRVFLIRQIVHPFLVPCSFNKLKKHEETTCRKTGYRGDSYKKCRCCHVRAGVYLLVRQNELIGKRRHRRPHFQDQNQTAAEQHDNFERCG